MNSIEEHKKMQYCVCRKHCLKANKTAAAFLLLVKLGRIFLKSCKTYKTWWIPTTPAAFRACQGLCTSLSEQACVQIFHIRASINCMSVYALETSVLAVPLMPGWLVPVKSGADINRPGCSHVSVYTGRPQSSTTRVLDSLFRANSHTIHLCLIQKPLLTSIHIQYTGTEVQCTCIKVEIHLHTCYLSISVVASSSPCAYHLDLFLTVNIPHKAIKPMLISVLQHSCKHS